MNLLDSSDESSNVLFVNFNQDCTSLTVGSKKGFKLYSITPDDNLEVIYENTTEDVCIVERLFSSSLVAMVTVSAPRKLKVCHFKKGTEICNYSYSNTILAVKLNRVRLVVCLEESLYIHNIKDMKVLHTIRDTPPNPNGLCVLSVSNINCFVAYPGSNSIGEVQIFDVFNLKAHLMIPAHDNPLAAMAFDYSGLKLATASEKGTVIRVFNVRDGSKLCEFRRGVKRCVSIYSLSFSENVEFLSASSNTETVHIFRLFDSKEVKPSEEPQGWIGYLGKAFMQSASYLPCQVADMFNQGRSFSTVHLPFSGRRNICTLIVNRKCTRIIIVANDGLVYIYNLDTVEGGDCTLVKTHRIYGSDDEIDGDSKSIDCNAGEGAAEQGSPSEQQANQRSNQTGGASYAEVVRGNETSSAQELNQDNSTTAHPTPPASLQKNELKLNDESEFPPMTYKSEV